MKLDYKTTPELVALRETLTTDPTNRQDGFFMYNPATRKKLDAIDRQITHNIIETKKACGKYIEPSGYSGRKQNRSR